MLYVRLIPPGAADVAHYRVQHPEGRQGPDHADGEAELSQVRALLHAVRLRRQAEAGPGHPIARRHSHNSLEYSFDRRTSRRTSRARSRARSRTCRSSSWPTAEAKLAARRRQDATAVEAGGPKERPRAMERLGHRPAAAGRSQGRRVRVHCEVTEAEPGYADGWLNVARALIQEGETDGRQAVHREGARDRSEPAAASTSSRR